MTSSAPRSEIEQLVSRLQDRDDSALEPFIEATRELGYRVAYSYLKDRHLAEDALQDSYLIVYRKIDTLREAGAFRTWFCRIVSNRCRRLLRDRPPETPSLEEYQEPSDDRMEERVENRLAVRRVLDNLPAIDRTVLNLREVMGFSYDDMAKVLKIPIGTVRSRLSKARLRLHKAFTQGRQK